MKSRTGLLVLTICMAALLAPAAAHACTISWVGGVASAPSAWYGFDPHGAGTADDQYNWNQQRFPDFTDDVCFPAGSVASTQHVDQNTPSARSIAISANASLTVSDVDLIVHENSTNAGNLIMAGPQSLLISDGDASDHEGLTNTGTIHFTPGAAGVRMILGDLLNQGTIDVDHPDASIQESGPGTPPNSLQTNQGTIDISPGNNLRSIYSNFINSTGVITGGGSMSMDQARFEAAGNSQIVAPTDINVTNTQIAGSAGSTATGNLDVVGAFNGGGPSTLEGTVPAGITLDVEPAVTLQAPAVTTTVNAGRINLNGPGSELKVLPNDSGNNSTSKLTNAASGTIEFTTDSPPADGLRLITGNLENQGSILVNDQEAGFQFPGGTTTPPKLTNHGTITISAGNALRVLSATLDTGASSVINGAATGSMNMAFSRFEISGNSQISGPDVNFANGVTLAGAAGSSATGNVDVVGGLQGQGPSSLEGTVPAGITIDLDGPAPELQSPAVTTTVNAGRINLNSAGAILHVLPNDPNNSTAKLTNTGTIAYASGGQIQGNLVNSGTLQVNASGQVQSGGGNTPPQLTNTASGTVNVAAGQILVLYTGAVSSFQNTGAVNVAGQLQAPSYVQTGGTTTLTASGATNTLALVPGGAVLLQGGTLRGTGIVDGDVQNTGGTIAPGTSPGILTFKRNYSQGAGGTLAVDVAGDAAGTGYDQLVVTGMASLGGTLAITTAGFSPATGQQFKVLDAPEPPASPTVSGVFATVQPTGGRTYQVAYNPTDVTLTADALPPPPDADGDGIPDASDNCPNEAGPASNGGCPVTATPADADGDGVPDASDNCPFQAGPASNGGCPVVANLPADDTACKAATDKLEKAKAKLKKLKRTGAPAKKIKKAKKKVKHAKQGVKTACA